jgi:hypothetical protein
VRRTAAAAARLGEECIIHAAAYLLLQAALKITAVHMFRTCCVLQCPQ